MLYEIGPTLIPFYVPVRELLLLHHHLFKNSILTKVLCGNVFSYFLGFNLCSSILFKTYTGLFVNLTTLYTLE